MALNSGKVSFRLFKCSSPITERSTGEPKMVLLRHQCENKECIAVRWLTCLLWPAVSGHSCLWVSSHCPDSELLQDPSPAETRDPWRTSWRWILQPHLPSDCGNPPCAVYSERDRQGQKNILSKATRQIPHSYRNMHKERNFSWVWNIKLHCGMVSSVFVLL